jgi:L-ribulokinase
LILGFHLATRSEDVYRALLESVAFGTMRIVENFQDHAIPITRLLACGGLPLKSSLLMQIYADVTGLSVAVSDSEEIPARGSAIFGAVAAGPERGGYASVEEASRRLAAPVRTTYTPNPEAHRVYQTLYALYRELHDVASDPAWAWMHRLKEVRLDAHHRRQLREDA